MDANRLLAPGDVPPVCVCNAPGPGPFLLDRIGIAPADSTLRYREIYAPYHAQIAALLDRPRSAGLSTVFVSLHSVAPTLQGRSRPWKVGALHRGDSPMSRRMLALLAAELGEEPGPGRPPQREPG